MPSTKKIAAQDAFVDDAMTAMDQLAERAAMKHGLSPEVALFLTLRVLRACYGDEAYVFQVAQAETHGPAGPGLLVR